MADINLDSEVQTVRLVAGDDFVFTVRIKENGTPAPLDDWDIISEIRDKKTGDLIHTLTVGDGITKVVSPVGDATIVVPKEVTEQLRTIACLALDIQTVNPAGLTRTFLKMYFSGSMDITQV